MNSNVKEELQRDIEDLGYHLSKVLALGRTIEFVAENPDNFITEPQDLSALSNILNRYLKETYQKANDIELKLIKI